MKIIGYLSWLLRAALFVALFLFAVRNTDPVTLRFYFEQTWQTPLNLALLAFFAFGAALGVLACLGRLFRQRREILSLKRQLESPAPESSSRDARQPGPASPSGS